MALDTIDIAAKAGANVIVCGSACFLKKVPDEANPGKKKSVVSTEAERLAVITGLRNSVFNAGFVDSP